MIGLVPALLLGLSGADLQPTGTRNPDPLIVTGRRLPEYRRNLEECLRRNCRPDEDIDATTALAEALFMEGEYGDARQALRASIRRNRRHAFSYPEPVSDLFRANARVSRHLGFDQEAARSTRETLTVLQEGLPTEDHRHFTARLELAQALQAFGRYDQARRELQELAERARAAGRQDVADIAELRRLWISYLERPSGPATGRLQTLARISDPARARLALGARTLLVRIYSERGDTARADALVAELGRSSGNRRLLFAPPYELLQREDMGASGARLAEIASHAQGGIGAASRPLLTSNMQDRMVGNMADQWIDVAFRISPEGRVEELAVVRRGRGHGGWEAPVLRSINGRRYSASADGQRTYRIERYTYTSEVRFATSGSRIAQHSPRARVEYFDLSSGTR